MNSGRVLSIALAIALVATWGYMLYDKNRSKNEIEKTDRVIEITTQERDDLKRQLDDATVRYDFLKTASSKKDSAITAKDYEIREKKSRIQMLLARADAGKKELSEARALIASMNSDLDSYRERIEILEGQKIRLTMEKNELTGERDQLVRQVDSARVIISERDNVIDVGSTLHTSGFDISTIHEKSGGKEVSTNKARRTDKLRIRFDLDENMIAPSGTKQLFIIITDPSGKQIADTEMGSGTFTTRDGRDLTYTQRVDVNYTQNQRQRVEFDWKQSGAYLPGNYRIEVYHNGFKIGEGARPLK